MKKLAMNKKTWAGLAALLAVSAVAIILLVIQFIGDREYAEDLPFDPPPVVSVHVEPIRVIQPDGKLETEVRRVEPFMIKVVDSATGRGIPNIELKTTSNGSYVTDSAGIIALDEPALFGQEVFFHISGDGYSYPKDGFGYAGRKIRVSEGGQTEIRLTRTDIAERIYRVTGQGIYRDSRMLGLPVPIEEPSDNEKVLGQLFTQVAEYKGKLYWFFGETFHASTPLRSVRTTGAVSDLPGQGGTDPDAGIPLRYFTDDNGFAKEMVPFYEGDAENARLEGLATVKDKNGKERLIAGYASLNRAGIAATRGILVFNDEKEQFELIRTVDPKDKLRSPHGSVTKYEEKGKAYLIFNDPWPTTRVPATLSAVLDPAQYEFFTCLKEGATFDGEHTELDRDAKGNLICGWKKDTPHWTFEEERRLVNLDVMKEEEARFLLEERYTGKRVQLRQSNISWNAYREKWVLIGEESAGFGEIWYAEADSPTGPWKDAVKIISYPNTNDYAFRDVRHIAALDGDGGRVLYMTGTYTLGNTSGVKRQYYDNNQLMYKLELDHSALGLAAADGQDRDGVQAGKAKGAEVRISQDTAGEGADQADASASSAAFADLPFMIRVVDSGTGRGVPLIELETMNAIKFVTDSHGVVAFHEPDLMDQVVFFHIKGHGYKYPHEYEGFAGEAIQIKPGETVTLEIDPINIAERLYRITGEGIYRDSVKLGLPVPLEKPVLNAEIVGQDSAQAVPYNGKIFWLWGDTGRLSYPLGNFRTTSATSELPGQGGLDPDEGINLHYFTKSDGFSKEMVPMFPEGGNLAWLFGLTTVKDPFGRERLISGYTTLHGLTEPVSRGVLLFNDSTQQFERLAKFDVEDEVHYPSGVSTKYADGGQEYVLFAKPFANVRIPATLEAARDPEAYEVYTCLKPGARFAGSDTELDRDANGRLICDWKKNSWPLTQDQEKQLIQFGLLKPEEALYQIKDVDTGKEVLVHGASIKWNEYRQKWVMIFMQNYGETSLLGEIWYTEADSPNGPWKWARKIITHEGYSFYNVLHHGFFDKENGRIIYFEGTYTNLFTNEKPTPHYEYNQIMYRLDLDNPRLGLPLTPSEEVLKAVEGE